ncbi:MAG: heparan-alpha-glucosaminide N-acetyltransferase domain-containing protein, partial [Candidatus Caldatribacteriaceae bacterium]
ILHCIGTSIVIGYFFLRLSGKFYTLVGSMACLLSGFLLNSRTFSFSFLLPLGFVPHSFKTVDYFPLFPWLGVVLLGIAFGKGLYHGYQRSFYFPDWSKIPLVQGISYLGRHSLTIYLLHQPILITILFFLGMIKLPL